MSDEQALTVGKALVLSGSLLLLLAGWLFTLIINSQQHLRDRQEILAERVSYLEAKIKYKSTRDCPSPNG